MNTISNTLFVGKVFITLASVDSTNAYAHHLCATTSPIDGTAIFTTEQTQGRGQLNNKWESEPQQNIALSIIFKPDFLKIANHFLLNQAIALGVHDLISQYVKEDVKIKWSNDIYVGSNKIGGILIQNSIQGTNIQHSIVGIGLNINQTEFSTAVPNPTSLRLLTQKDYDLLEIVEQLCIYLENRYLQLKSGQHLLLKKDYADRLYLNGIWAKYLRTADNNLIIGKIEGVKESGELILRTNMGLEIFDFKEIKFLHQPI